MMRRLVIFDGNHLAYRAFYKFGNLKTIDGVKTGIVFGMPYVAESLIRRLGPNRVVITFDGGRSKFRTELLPDYKKRDYKLGFDYEDFHRQKDAGRDIFVALGLRVVWKKGFEADDLIAQVARRYSNKGWEVVIVSADKDFHQLVKPLDTTGAIMMYNVNKAKMFDDFYIRKYIGYRPDQCVDYLCLTGDKSDNIPGYPGIGEKRGKLFLEKFGSIKVFLNLGEGFGKMDKVKLKEIYQRNRKLIDLMYFYRRHLINEKIPYFNSNIYFDEDRLKSICAQYEINSFLKPQFINTFKNLYHG